MLRFSKRVSAALFGVFAGVSYASAEDAVTVLSLEGLLMTLPPGMQIVDQGQTSNSAIVTYQRAPNGSSEALETVMVLSRDVGRTVDASDLLKGPIQFYHQNCNALSVIKNEEFGVHGLGPTDSYLLSLCSGLKPGKTRLVQHTFANEYSAHRTLVRGTVIYAIQYTRASNDPVGEAVTETKAFKDVINPAMLSVELTP